MGAEDAVKDWTRAYFTDEYLLKYRERLEAQTKDECDFIGKCLRLADGGQVLDIACGYGRHVKELLARGVEAWGIDACELFIQEADTPRCSVGDMRAFDSPPVQAAFNFFTSFGYFSDEENEAVVENVSRVLVPGGRFLLHTRNREWLMRNYVQNQWDAYEGHTELTTRRFDLPTSRMETEITYLPAGRVVHQSIRFYTLAEIMAMFRRHDMAAVMTYGGTDFSPYTIDSEWMAVVGEKV